MNLSPQYYNAKNIRNKISSAKNELMDLQSFANLEYDKNIVKIYEKYLEKLKLNKNTISYAELDTIPSDFVTVKDTETGETLPTSVYTLSAANNKFQC